MRRRRVSYAKSVTALMLLGGLLTVTVLPHDFAAAQPVVNALPAAYPALRVETIFQRWQAAMDSAKMLSCQVKRTSLDRIFNQTTIYEGTFLYMKPNLGCLELWDRKDPANFEKFISDGKSLYVFFPGGKIILERELPLPKPKEKATGWLDFSNGFLSYTDFLQSCFYGMSADEAMRRYTLKVTSSDAWYIYIDLTPRQELLKSILQRARLVLLQGSYLPRQLWYCQPNGNEVTWDVLKVEKDAKLNQGDFVLKVPPGWKVERGFSPPKAQKP